MAAVALIIMLSGGQAFHFRLARLVARRPVVPLALLVVSAVWLGRKANRSATLAELARIYNSIERAALPLAFLLAVATFWTGMRWGSFVAGGSDSYGYVSQAHLWAAGDGLIAVRPLPNAPFPDADWVLSPLGYRPGPVPGTIVPSYPSGYPLLMALAIRLAGSQAAFVVVPLLGAIGVLFTFLIGRKLGDAVSGLLASAWLATHPVFLRQIMQPMSDAPAMTAVLLAIWFALRPDKHAPFLSGCIAAGAMLIRPNLILLAAPIVLLFWFSRSPESWSPVRKLAAFAVGFLPGAILLGAFQCTLYGSPLASGYGSIELMFRFKNATTNIARSTRWLMETGSPLIFLGFLAPIITNYRKWAAAVLLIIVAGIGPYIFYSVFDAWWYLRFYLPVIPLLLILSSALLTRVSTNLLSDLRVLPLAAACLLLCVTGMRKAEQEGSFDHRTSEQRFELVSLYAHRTLPENAAIICVHYSGSLRFYADRLTLRWDWIKEPRLDRWVAWLHKKGYPPYLIVEDWERTQFKARFSEYSALATLDWCHIAIQKRPPFVRIYDLHDRKPFVANEYEPIDTIP